MHVLASSLEKGPTMAHIDRLIDQSLLRQDRPCLNETPSVGHDHKISRFSHLASVALPEPRRSSTWCLMTPKR